VGSADGRGLAAVMALGASGAWIGTRFLASNEAAIHPRYRERLLKATENDTVFLEQLFDVGWPSAPHRVLRNKTVAAWEAAGRPPSGKRLGEGEVIATSPTSGQIVRYQSYTPGADAEGDIEALTPLRQRMIEDMNARKLCAGTQRGHIRSCRRFAF
jgi:NAD(P)H-dependent flavin oxidoreductase YrpB (nitropropane dioxygenase family)